MYEFSVSFDLFVFVLVFVIVMLCYVSVCVLCLEVYANHLQLQNIY